MATVVNNPNGEGSGAGLIIGIIVAVLLIFLLIRYGIPAIRGGDTGTNINVSVPNPVDNVGNGQ